MLGMLLLMVTSANAFLVTDDFNDGLINSTIWDGRYVYSTYYLNETTVTRIWGNSSGGSSTYVFSSTKDKVNTTNNAQAKVKIKYIAGVDSNTHFGFSVSDHIDFNSWVSSPPTYCGLTVQVTNNNYRLVHNYPSASLLQTIQAIDGSWHDIEINISRGASNTTYYFYWDGNLNYTEVQGTACDDPSLNATMWGYSLSASVEEMQFDDFSWTDFDVPAEEEGEETPTGCEAPTCEAPCIYHDPFNYTCSVEEMGWTLSPSDPTLVPVNEKLCEDPSGIFSAYVEDIAISDNPLDEIITAEFNMSVNLTASNFIIFYDETDFSSDYIYFLQWVYNGSDTFLYSSTENSSDLLCTNCWTQGAEHNYRIQLFQDDTEGNVFYNQTSGLMQPILPYTFTLIIDDNSSNTFYNVPEYMRINSEHWFDLEWWRWDWWDGNVCIDEVRLYQGTTWSEGVVIEPSAECEYNPIPYVYPTLWADYFQYNDALTEHGWVGYPFVIGENPIEICDMLYYDTDDSDEYINYTMPTPIYNDFSIQWEYGGDSPANETSYYLCGAPVQWYAWDDEDNLVAYLVFSQVNDGEKCNITSYGNYTFDDVGFWGEGGGNWDYKLEFNMTSKQFDFYYTDLSSPYDYVKGCDDCFWYNTSSDNIAKFGWRPIYPIPAEQDGFWLDTIIVKDLGEPDTTYTTNFCYFDGCIYHDHFDYDNAVKFHGWYLNEQIPTDSYIEFDANPYSYWLDHTFDVFRNTDAEGIITIQFRAMLREQTSTVNSPQFYLYGADYTKTPLVIEFDSGIVSDLNSGTAIGSYQEDRWYEFAFVVDLDGNTYDFYMDESLMANDQAIEDMTTSVAKIGFHTVDNPIWIDSVTVSEGYEVIADIIETLDTGVPSEHLQECWSDNGTFDWSCCEDDEEEEKSLGCVTRVTFFYGIGSLTNFILRYILYFIVLAIFFVLLTPYILKSVRGNQ